MLLNEFRLEATTIAPKDAEISAVIALVYNESGEILVVKNPRGWDFPGGHVEPGETPEQALHREVLEEAYVTIRNPRLFMSATADTAMLFYIAEAATILDFKVEHETTERAFLHPTELLERYGGGMPEIAEYVIAEAQERL